MHGRRGGSIVHGKRGEGVVCMVGGGESGVCGSRGREWCVW